MHKTTRRGEDTEEGERQGPCMALMADEPVAVAVACIVFPFTNILHRNHRMPAVCDPHIRHGYSVHHRRCDGICPHAFRLIDLIDLIPCRRRRVCVSQLSIHGYLTKLTTPNISPLLHWRLM